MAISIRFGFLFFLLKVMLRKQATVLYKVCYDILFSSRFNLYIYIYQLSIVSLLSRVREHDDQLAEAL